MLKGINQWCFQAGTPLEEVFEHSRRAGFDAVELNLYEPGGIGLTMDTTAAEAEAVGLLARQHGLQLRSLSTGLMGRNPLSSDDPSARAQGRKVVEKQLELAELLGIDTVLVVPGVVDRRTGYDVCYRRSRDELAKLLPAAEKRGVGIGIENVWNKFLLSPLEMARYVDELDSPSIGVYFDAGNVLQIGFPEQWIRILGKRIRKIHVKDYREEAGYYPGFVPLLSGDADWNAVREALRDIGYEDVLTAELGLYASAPLQVVYDAARHLEVIINGNIG